MRAAFDLSASSSWRETAETRERARDAENELALQREATRSLRTQLHAAEQQRRDDVKSLEKQISVLKTQVAEEAARADDRVRSVVSSESKKQNDLQERHSRLRREHAALQAAVGRAGGGARGASELETSLTSERDDRFVKQLELVERNVRAEGRRAYEALERAKETQIAQLRSQSAKFLADANAELTAVKADLERTKKHAERRVELLSSELDELRSWASKMNGVLTKIEQGAYPVVERGFWRSLRVPPAEISFAKAVPNETPRDPLYGASEARTRSISRAVDNTSRFLETMEDHAMATSGVAEFRAGSASDARPNAKSVSGSIPVAFGVSTSKSIDPYDTVPYDASTSNAKAGETFELEAFKRHGALVEEERAAVQEATLKELSSHPTVEYIRALEEENQKMKTDLSRERRSASDARVALQSARRQQEKHLAEKSAFSTRLHSRGGHTNEKPRASSARAHGARPTSAFGATVPKETFVGPPMSPESFRATMHDGRGQNAVIHTSSGLHASIKPHNKNAPLTSPEVVERVRVTTMSRDAARRASARRARAGVDDVATGASVGYLARQSSSLENKEDDLGYLRKLSSSRKNEPPDTDTGSTSPRPPFGVAGGRRLTDTVPLAGRPLSGSAEVGYGFVLGDGPDAQGGAVGWPVGADRAKSLAERPETGPGGVRSGGAKRT
jgi:hypothetical protein